MELVKKMKTMFSKNISIVSAIIVMIIAGFVGCQREENEPLDEVILNSPELEDYIIAGADLQKSLAIFTSELNKVDFSKLEVSYDAEGRKFRRFPTGSVSIRIEEKIQTFNEKREILRKKFPQIASFREDIGKEYFQQSIKNSVKVQGEFLKLGINTSRPLLKAGNGEGQNCIFYNSVDLTNYLYSWINEHYDYKELVIFIHSDGSYTTFLHPQATANKTWIPELTTYGGYLFYHAGGNFYPVVGVAHTHPGNNYAPSTYPQGDPQEYLISEYIVPGIPNYTYSNYGFWCFYGNCPD